MITREAIERAALENLKAAFKKAETKLNETCLDNGNEVEDVADAITERNEAWRRLENYKRLFKDASK